MTPKVRRGPKLATKSALMGLALLSIPWLGYTYLGEMKQFLVEGQANALMLTAQGVATLLEGSEDLLSELPKGIDDYQQLSTYQLEQPIRLDAYDEDWQALAAKRAEFGSYTDLAGRPSRARFNLLLGTRNDYLYGFIEIQDRTPILRHPRYLRLDNGDHLRISFLTPDEQISRLLLTIEGQGNASAYYVDSDWYYALGGQPEYRLQAVVRQEPAGYIIEFRLPLSLLGPQRKLGIAYADVSDAELRQPGSITGSYSKLSADNLSLVLLRSPQVENLLRGLTNQQARTWILDASKRVRAISGEITAEPANPSPLNQADSSAWEILSYALHSFVFDSLIDPNATAFEDFDPQLTQFRNEALIEQALRGESNYDYRASLDGRARIISAAYPIRGQTGIIGAVLMEQSASSILRMQRQSLERVVASTLLVLLLVFAGLLLFSARMAWRIHRLGSEAGSAIDKHGRLLVSRLNHQVGAADEIGDLARNISGLLSKLHQYQEFIARMPRTLRHEINNPLNTMSTSLQQIEQQTSDAQVRDLIASAQRGVRQISYIMHQLAESASLEQALQSEDLSTLDLQALLDQYLSHFAQAHPDVEFEFLLPQQPVLVSASDLRIEQMLDKLLANAMDFSDGKAPIGVRLYCEQTLCHIEVSNSGPAIDSAIKPLLFNSLASSRASTPGSTHIGLGLYVARLIVEFHNGHIQAQNQPDNQGVIFKVSLPRHPLSAD